MGPFKAPLTWLDALAIVVIYDVVTNTTLWMGGLLVRSRLLRGLPSADLMAFYGPQLVGALLAIAVLALVIGRQARSAAAVVVLSAVGFALYDTSTDRGVHDAASFLASSSLRFAVSGLAIAGGIAATLARQGLAASGLEVWGRRRLIVAAVSAPFVVTVGLITAVGAAFGWGVGGATVAYWFSLVCAAALPYCLLGRFVAVGRAVALQIGHITVRSLLFAGVVGTYDGSGVWRSYLFTSLALAVPFVVWRILSTARDQPVPDGMVEVDGYGQPRITDSA